MLVKKDFYFIRHGETELNAQGVIHDLSDVSLNATGIAQAELAKSFVEVLPIKTICVSPLKRATETKDIITMNLSCPTVIVEELGECNGDIWLKMTNSTQEMDCPNTQEFMRRTLSGINQALSYPGPVLIVSHGGIHWALCHQIGVRGYEKKIGNCSLAHFFFQEDRWQARHIAHTSQFSKILVSDAQPNG